MLMSLGMSIKEQYIIAQTEVGMNLLSMDSGLTHVIRHGIPGILRQESDV